MMSLNLLHSIDIQFNHHNIFNNIYKLYIKAIKNTKIADLSLYTTRIGCMRHIFIKWCVAFIVLVKVSARDLL